MQMAGKNQIPSCCMFRREFFTRAGGYDKRYTPAEDANLWLKIFSLGGIPQRAASEPLMEYRTHDKGLSSSGVFPNWWNGCAPRFEMPIEERDPRITIILDDTQNAKETLWSLENQENKNWNCHTTEACPLLKESFPWLTDKKPNRLGSVLKIAAGTVLLPNFLTRYAQQTPPWTRDARFLSP
jgi:hypothetical protein